jgi:flagellar hook-associated protein 1 FlgK
MSIAASALLAEQGAIEASTNNVANANTPGYSRQRPVLESAMAVGGHPLSFGTGVTLARLEGIRDPLLELQVNAETQQNGKWTAAQTALQQVEVQFPVTGGLGDRLSAFFTSLSRLQTDPASMPMRQAVLIAAGNLADSFRQTAGNLTRQRAQLDLGVSQTVEQINTYSRQIAELNREINTSAGPVGDANGLVDQRNLLINQLSELIDVAQVSSDQGVTLTTANGSPLVTAGEAFALNIESIGGMQHVMSLGTDITAAMSGGKLAGMLEARDQNIPGILAQLDTLAAGFTNAVNAAHVGGFDLNGAPGGLLFSAPPAAGAGAAAAMSCVISDPSLLAASSDGSPGSNGNLTALAGVADQGVASGQTAEDFYANLVAGVGRDLANATAEQDASSLNLTQLNDQKAGVSGVSLDEEAANLTRYQQAYQAAARVFSIVNTLLDTAVQLGKN